MIFFPPLLHSVPVLPLQDSRWTTGVDLARAGERLAADLYFFTEQVIYSWRKLKKSISLASSP
jgi:hypothetical protein